MFARRARLNLGRGLRLVFAGSGLALPQRREGLIILRLLVDHTSVGTRIAGTDMGATPTPQSSPLN
jgi:hypothetical protein